MAYLGYLTSEVVEDWSDGLISRPEALRRRMGGRYDPTQAAAAAWADSVAWFDEHLALSGMP